MMKNIYKIITFLIITIAIFLVFYKFSIDNNTKDRENANLVVFGDNISTKYSPFVKNDGIYISVDTIQKLLDEHIYYDKIATKVIVTTEDKVLKLKTDDTKMSVNMEYQDIKNPVIYENNQAYVDITILKDIYDIKVDYNETANVISIDKKTSADIPVKYNRVNLYEDINTNSKVLQTLYKSDFVTVYTESLNHKRWYKVKTDTGVIGYIPKNAIDSNLINTNTTENTETEVEEVKNVDTTGKKITMFWQYGSDLNVLEAQKIDGVSVVSPTWFELKNSNGEISSKFSQEYYNKAKQLGYEIWPIVNNGIDSVSYSPEDTSKMLNSEQNREQFINNLLTLCKNNKLDGINIDFEAMKTEDRSLYTQFIRELVPMFKANNIKVSVDMYFVEYIDRKQVGKAVDYVVLMGYDQRGSWSNEAGSIAEVSWVEKNIKSLINDSGISSDKIILGVPFYTRLWTVKNDGSKPTTKVYDMQDCQDFIKSNNITTVLDTNAGQNYGEIKKGNITYKLWLEDAVSIKNRVEIVNKYNLAGITGWRKGFETEDIWGVIKENLK